MGRHIIQSQTDLPFCMCCVQFWFYCVHPCNHVFNIAAIIEPTVIYIYHADLNLSRGEKLKARYYFCWPSLWCSAAWWLSPRQCIISPMRAVIIRTVWMSLYNVEMKIWWWRSTGWRFLEMNTWNCFIFLLLFVVLFFTSGHKMHDLLTFVLLTFPVRKSSACFVTYWESGTWAALSVCKCLGGTWRSRPWLSAFPRRFGWGFCRYEWSGSSLADLAP